MPGRCSNTTSPPNGFKSRGRVRRTLDLIGCPPTRSMLRLPRRGMRGTPPGFNRVHDSGRSRHQHHRLGPLAAARAARADFYADAQRFASTLRQWSYLRGVRRGNQPPPLWPRPRYYRRDSGNHTRQGYWVKPIHAVIVCPDPDDNMFLECAEAAQSAYLVTGNLRHFPASWQGTAIVTARMMLDIIQTGTATTPA